MQVKRPDPRRRLPSVEAVAAAAARLDGASALPRGLVVKITRHRLGEARSGGEATSLAALAAEVARDAAALLAPALVPVINATGVVVQTNLGRSPLSEAASAAAAQVAMGYSNLEYDLRAGARGERAASLSNAFEALTGRPAVVVNNNASSLVLCLHTLARGREVLVSRGELVEIGGSFRLPDVMRLSGARLVEVGTTNRTRLADYADAITSKTAAILKVHQSNFQVVGFTASASTSELAALARQHDIHFVEDLGSGSLIATEPYGLAHEPTIQEVLAAGVELVCFSGDKLLGGPQAGIIVGAPELVGRLRRAQLYRALRPDKMTLAALGATLAAYVRGTAVTELPVWRMIATPSAETRRRARNWARQMEGFAEVVPVKSAVGGGSLPGAELDGYGLAVTAKVSAQTLARRLRGGSPPVVGRVHDGRVVLDPRTVLPGQDDDLVAALRSALRL